MHVQVICADLMFKYKEIRRRDMNTTLQECIAACYKCAAACDYCASSCLNEPDIDMMRNCIKTDIECSAVCRLAAQLMGMKSEYHKQQCRLCVDICRACAEECARHEHEHCKHCAEACRQCADACLRMLA